MTLAYKNMHTEVWKLMFAAFPIVAREIMYRKLQMSGGGTALRGDCRDSARQGQCGIFNYLADLAGHIFDVECYGLPRVEPQSLLSALPGAGLFSAHRVAGGWFWWVVPEQFKSSDLHGH
jgi:hypothetical protein